MSAYVVTRMGLAGARCIARPPNSPYTSPPHVCPAYDGATELITDPSIKHNWCNCEDGQVNAHCTGLGRAPTCCKCRRGGGEPVPAAVLSSVPRSGLELTTSQTEHALQEHKQQAKLIFRRITPNSEPRCSIESGQYTLQYVSRTIVVTCCPPDSLCVLATSLRTTWSTSSYATRRTLGS